MPTNVIVNLATVDVVLVDTVPPAPANRPQTGSLSSVVPTAIKSLSLPAEYEFVGGHEVPTTNGAAAFFRNSKNNALLHVGVVPREQGRRDRLACPQVLTQ